jgi:hypothetical protein
MAEKKSCGKELQFQTYLKDRDCKSSGILIYNDLPHCRYCRKVYATGGKINYNEDHFIKEEYPKIISFRSK